MSGIPVAVEANLTAAVNTFNSSPSVAQGEICEQYRSIQYAENYTANQATVRSLRDQLAAAEEVSVQLVALANQHGNATVAAIAADQEAQVAWQNTRQATIAASVASQIASVVATIP